MSGLVPPKLETLFQLVDLIAKDKSESDRLISRGLCLGLTPDGLVSWAPAATLRTRVYTSARQHGRVGMWTVCNLESLFSHGLSVDIDGAYNVMTRGHKRPEKPVAQTAAVSIIPKKGTRVRWSK